MKVGVVTGFPDLFYDMIKKEDGGLRLDADQRVLIRGLSRFEAVMGVFSRGFGKCVTGDTMLFTDKGVKEIGDFFDYQSDGIETYTDHNINLLNRYGELENSSKGIYSGFKQTKKIKTEEGYEIETTLNHPLLVMTESGQVEWRKAEGIAVGDYVPINRDNDIWGDETRLDIDMEAFLQGHSDIVRRRLEKFSCNALADLTSEMSLILGYLVGDGMMTRENYFVFSNGDEDILKRYTDFMVNVLGVKVSKKSGDNVDYVTSGMYTREYLRQVGLEVVDAFGKEVPKCVMRAPKEMVASFISGLFDADGGISNSHIEYCTASKKLSMQVQTLLLNFGIVSRRSEKFNKRFKTYSYPLLVMGKNMDIFAKEIGFSSKRKQERLNEVCNVERNTNKDVIPYQRDAVVGFNNNAKKHTKGLWRKVDVSHIKSGECNLTYERMDRLLCVNGAMSCDNYNHLKELQDSNYFYSRVLSVEERENHVYDLQMSQTESFISNGFVSHNTLIQLMANYHACVFYPGIEVAMTAQTKENASNLIGEKWREMSRFFPMMTDELLGDPKISKDKAVVSFKSGGKQNCLPMLVTV